MFKWSELTEELVKRLKTLPVWNLTTSGKEIAVRCPFCGDSRKHANSAHLYINLEASDTKPHTFYCQRCQTAGVVNSELLRRLRIYDSELAVGLAASLKRAGRRNSRFRAARRSELKIPVPERTRLNLAKLRYINQRLGTDLSLEDLPRFKIAPSLYDLLDANGVESLNVRDPSFADDLDHNFLGFVSYDNNYVILRNLSAKKHPKIRYYNYNVWGNYDNSKRFYVIPTRVDVLEPRLEVSIAEGIFDILGVYFNLDGGGRPGNAVYAAVNGVGFGPVLTHLAGMGFLDMDVRLYSDADQGIHVHRRMKRDLGDLIPGKIQVFYNRAGKDFGVRKEGISLTRTLV